MQPVETWPDEPSASGAHFQIFLIGNPGTVRWRLLSGNNRDMCHGVAEYTDPQICRIAILDLRSRVGEMQPIVKRDTDGNWTWVLLDEGLPVAAAGHSYDRQIRCSRAMLKVLKDAPGASIRTQMVVSDHRRWPGSRMLSRGHTIQSPRRIPT